MEYMKADGGDTPHGGDFAEELSLIYERQARRYGKDLPESEGSR